MHKCNMCMYILHIQIYTFKALMKVRVRVFVGVCTILNVKTWTSTEGVPGGYLSPALFYLPGIGRRLPPLN